MGLRPSDNSWQAEKTRHELEMPRAYTTGLNLF